jgi:hypothetical protein
MKKVPRLPIAARLSPCPLLDSISPRVAIHASIFGAHADAFGRRNLNAPFSDLIRILLSLWPGQRRSNSPICTLAIRFPYTERQSHTKDPWRNGAVWLGPDSSAVIIASLTHNLHYSNKDRIIHHCQDEDTRLW